MGKRQSKYTGLSRFVQEAFSNQQQQPESSSSSQEKASSQTQTTSNARNAAHLDNIEPAESSTAPPASKKRKVGLLGLGSERYDATGLVAHYTDASEVPENLRKYFFQRERYFSLYSSGCLLDEEGWYSVTPELIANQIAERCRCNTIVDAFCGVGGNAIAFAQTCERVIAIDTSPTRLALARHNAAIYGVQDRIEFILADYLSFARSYLSVDGSETKQRKIDVVFLSPPWGGPEYIAGDISTSPSHPSVSVAQEEDSQHPQFSLANIRPIHGAELFQLTHKITRNIAYFLPRNTNLDEISDLVSLNESISTERTRRGKSKEIVEVEEEWMGTKLKALTCYFGGLAKGQEHLFDEML